MADGQIRTLRTESREQAVATSFVRPTIEGELAGPAHPALGIRWVQSAPSRPATTASGDPATGTIPSVSLPGGETAAPARSAGERARLGKHSSRSISIKAA